MTDKARGPKLEDLLARLDAACQRLWDEDRTSAISVSAVAEEAKLELRRLEQAVKSLEEQVPEERRLGRMETETIYHEKVRELEARLRQTEEIGAGLKDSLAHERQRVEKLFRENESREEEVAQFKEKALKAEAERDATRSKKMGELAGDLEARSAELERLWTQRHDQLEEDHKRRREEMEKKHESFLKDLDSRVQHAEAGLREREESFRTQHASSEVALRERDKRVGDLETRLHQQAEAIVARAAELEKDYGRKRDELESIKTKMREQVAQAVRLYHGDGGEEPVPRDTSPSPPPRK